MTSLDLNKLSKRDRRLLRLAAQQAGCTTLEDYSKNFEEALKRSVGTKHFEAVLSMRDQYSRRGSLTARQASYLASLASKTRIRIQGDTYVSSGDRERDQKPEIARTGKRRKCRACGSTYLVRSEYPGCCSKECLVKRRSVLRGAKSN